MALSFLTPRADVRANLVLVATYNEVEDLPAMVEQLLRLGSKLDLLVVDDNSPDGTGNSASKYAAEHPRVHLIRRPRKEGPSAASWL
jgi:dolichol-phosphate mannosyltransferase